MVPAAATGNSTRHRTPWSATAFGALVIGLTVVFLFVAFAYGHGWSDVAAALLGLCVLLAWIAFWSLMAWSWSRGWHLAR